MVKEAFRVYNEVFDQSTLKVLNKFRGEYYDEIEYCISTGKEANVFRASTKKGFVAVKVFRTYTSNFDRIKEYMIGDPRFSRLKKGKHQLVYLWTKKEFRNLNKAYKLGVFVPKPFVFKKNVVIMEFIGEKGQASPLLKDYKMKKPLKWYNTIIENMKRLYKGGLVHADLSEFNILSYKNRPVLIDMAQSVLTEHPRAREFLKKDFKNINKFFKRKCKTINWKDFINN